MADDIQPPPFSSKYALQLLEKTIDLQHTANHIVFPDYKDQAQRQFEQRLEAEVLKEKTLGELEAMLSEALLVFKKEKEYKLSFAVNELNKRKTDSQALDSTYESKKKFVILASLVSKTYGLTVSSGMCDTEEEARKECLISLLNHFISNQNFIEARFEGYWGG